MHETSLSLLERLRHSPENESWNRLAELYTPLIRAWLRRYDVQDSDANDLVQEVLLAVSKDLGKFEHRGQPGAFRGWLKAILINRLRKFWRARDRRPQARGDSDIDARLAQLDDPASEMSRIWDREHDQYVLRQLMALVEPQFEPKTWEAFRRVALTERFSRGEGSRPTILEQIRSRRQAAQGPIVAVHQEIETGDCRNQIDRMVQEVESNRRGEGKRRFGRQASRYLGPVVKKFFKAAESDLTTDESLHTLRIRAKKVRYTMEITAAAFDTAFRKRLYRQVTLCQDLLGTINDHATARELFGEWLSQSEDVAEKAFLEGWLLAEQQRPTAGQSRHRAIHHGGGSHRRLAERVDRGQ